MERWNTYEVEKIMNSQFHYCKLQFLITWKGYGYEECSMVAMKFNPGENFSQNENKHLKLKLGLYLKYSPGLNVNNGL
jgi:hypothetical protein